VHPPKGLPKFQVPLLVTLLDLEVSSGAVPNPLPTSLSLWRIGMIIKKQMYRAIGSDSLSRPPPLPTLTVFQSRCNCARTPTPRARGPSARLCVVKD